MCSDQALGDGRLEDHPQYYAEHLSEVNNTNEVVSTEDIYNDRGVLLVRKGRRISRDVSEKLLQHKLAQPVYTQVDIRDRLKNASLRENYQALYRCYPDLYALLQGVGMDKRFHEMVMGVDIPSRLLQNLTVLRHQAPALFEKALFCALLSTLSAWRLELEPSEIRAAYFAGLFHDIGLLHVAPEVFVKTDALSEAEWRTIQSHVVVGKMLIQDNSFGVPPSTAQAVLEHHERCDGSGYPVAKGHDQLGVLGQIVGMADALQTIRAKPFERMGLTLANAVPFLQMNTTTHGVTVNHAMRMLLRQAGLIPVRFNPEDTLATFATRLAQRAGALERALEPVAVVANVVPELMLDRKYRALERIAERVTLMVHASGLLREELLAWLRSVSQDPKEWVIGELTEIELLHNELQSQLGSLQRMLYEVLQSNAIIPSQAREALGKAHEHIGQCLDTMEPNGVSGEAVAQGH